MKKFFSILLMLMLVTSMGLLAQQNVKFSAKYRLRTTVNDFSFTKSEANNWIETRLRLMGEYSIENTAKLVSELETGDLNFGGAGGQIGTRAVNVETRLLYIDINSPVIPANIKAGLIPMGDNSDNLIIANSVAGIKITPNILKDLNFGVFKAVENKNNDRNIYFLDYAKKMSDNLSFGAGLFFDHNRTKQDSTITDMHLHGFISYKPMNELTLPLYLIFNQGSQDKNDNYKHSGFAVNFKPAYKTKTYSLEGTFLMLSGDKKGKDYYRAIAEDYYSGLEILGKGIHDNDKKAQTTNFTEILVNPAGLMQIAGVFSYFFNDTYTFYGALGYASLMETANDKNSLGMEIDLGAHINLGKNLKYSLVGAILLPGEYHENRLKPIDVENVWTFNTALNYSF